MPMSLGHLGVVIILLQKGFKVKIVLYIFILSFTSCLKSVELEDLKGDTIMISKGDMTIRTFILRDSTKQLYYGNGAISGSDYSLFNSYTVGDTLK